MSQGADPLVLHRQAIMAQIAMARQQRQANNEPPAYATHVPYNAARADEDEEAADDMITPVNIKLDVSLKIDGEANEINFASDVVDPSLKLQTDQIEHFLKETIKTLKDNRLLESLDSEGYTRDRELNINVQAGISIKGEKNIVSPGLPRERPAWARSEVDIEGVRMVKTEAGDKINLVSRKRRSLSESTGATDPKKPRSN